MEMDELVAACDVAVDVNCRLESTETSSSSSSSNSSCSSAGTTTANSETTAAVNSTTNAAPTSSSSASSSSSSPRLNSQNPVDTDADGKVASKHPPDPEGNKSQVVGVVVKPESRSRIQLNIENNKQDLKDVYEDVSSNVTCDAPTNANLSTTNSTVAPTPPFQSGAVESLDELGTAERLDKYSMSDIVFHRQIAARSLLDTLHEVELYGKNLQLVTTVINRFANDPEPSIRAELAEQLPQIACFCLNPQNGVPPAMSNITLPILVQFLTDINSHVRKITQNSLAYMMEQSIVDLQFVEYKICPVLVHLMDITNMDDYRIEAVTTVSKIVRFLDKNVTEKVFLCHFSRLCSDVSFHVRRACAANFGEICSVVGKDLTESTLLAPFRSLCGDDIWGVRKACADVFVPVSFVCSEDIRKDYLSPLFVSLLCDQSKWVRTAAFQALGPFISTFADPSKTGIYYTEGGLVVVEDAKEHESNSSGSTDSGCSVDSSNSNDDCDTETATGNSNSRSLPSFVNKLSLSDLSTCYSGLANSPENMDTSPSLECVESGGGDSSSLGDSTTCVTSQSYNCFNYWRIPLGEFQVDPELSDCIDLNNSFQNKDSTNNNLLDNLNSSNDINSDMKELDQDDDDGDEVEIDHEDTAHCKKTSHRLSSQIMVKLNAVTAQDEKNDNLIKEGEPDVNALIDKFLSTLSGDLISESNNIGCMQDFNYMSVRKLLVKQETVPLDLLEHYLKMINPPASFEGVDPDLSHHCAYSFPAVAMTLGRKHWPCLKEAYEYLARDLHMKVRWTLASSLHQMALILGPEHTSRDLLPIFMSFTRDSEEVRFAILQNLSSILPLFNRIEQLAILPRIGDFLYSDKPRNWRFRYTLAEQVMGISSLYCPQDIKECLLPIAYTLLQDKVSEVRLAAIKLMSNLLKHFFCDVSSSVPRLDTGSMEAAELLSHWVSGLVDSRSKWIYRQSFVFLCEQMVVDDAIPPRVFNEYFLQHLLSLADDRVPNVRLALSRCLARSFYDNALYREQQEAVTSILTKFKADSDLDVRRFSQSVLTSDEVTSSQPDSESTVGVE